MRIAFIAAGALATLAVQGLARTVGVQSPAEPNAQSDRQDNGGADWGKQALGQTTQTVAGQPVAIAQPESFALPAMRSKNAIRQTTYIGGAGSNATSLPKTSAKSRLQTGQKLPLKSSAASATRMALKLDPKLARRSPTLANLPLSFTRTPMAANSAVLVADASMRNAIHQVYGTTPKIATVATTGKPLPTPGNVPASRAMFSDIQGHPARQAIEFLVQRGAIQGYADGTFGPNEPISDAQFNRLMKQAFNWNSPSTFQRPSQISTRAQAAEFVYQKLQIAQSITQPNPPSRTPSMAQALDQTGMSSGAIATPRLPANSDSGRTMPNKRPIAAAAADNSLELPTVKPHQNKVPGQSSEQSSGQPSALPLVQN